MFNEHTLGPRYAMTCRNTRAGHSCAPDDRTFIWLNNNTVQHVLRAVESTQNRGYRVWERIAICRLGWLGEALSKTSLKLCLECRGGRKRVAGKQSHYW